MTERLKMFIHELTDPDDKQKRSYREVNLEKKHKFKVGQLVETNYKDMEEISGVRMFIVQLSRDCDGTPLYDLSPDRDDIVQKVEKFRNIGWHGGYGEEGLKVVINDHEFVWTKITISLVTFAISALLFMTLKHKEILTWLEAIIKNN